MQSPDLSEPNRRFFSQPKFKAAFLLAFLLVAFGSHRLWKKRQELQRADSQIEALCQSVLDPEADQEERCINASILRSFTDPAAKTGSSRMRSLAQMSEAAYILAYCPGLSGDLLSAQLSSAEHYLTLALNGSNSQIAESAKKGLSLLPKLRKGDSGMAPEEVFGFLETEKLVPPRLPGSHAPRNSDVTFAVQNQDSRKFADEKEIKAEQGSLDYGSPSFDGGGAKLLFEALGKQFGLHLKPVGQLPKRRRYVPALRDFDLFESKEQPLTGLSGDAVTQNDALLQIAFRVKLPGTSPQQKAEAATLFNQALKYFEEAKAAPFMDWILQKERVALMEPDQPFYAQTTVETNLITLRYRPGNSGVSRPSFSVDFEEKGYFQWLLAQLPQETPRPGK